MKIVVFFLFFPLLLFGQVTEYVCPPCGAQCDELTFDLPGLCPHCAMRLIRADQAGAVSIAFYLQDGVEILDFAGPMEVFAYAGFEVFTVSKTKEPIVSQGILTVLPDYGLNDAPPSTVVAFFGGNAGAAYRDTAVIKWLRGREVAYHFSVCTGAFVLGEAGLLDGKTATTFHRALDDLERRYPAAEVRRDVRFVDNGRLITTAGISAGIDGALHLVARLRGFNAARSAAYHMEYDKWTPGEGLILTDENPYVGRPDATTLNAYVGVYEGAHDVTVTLHLDPRERELVAVIAEDSYPVYFEGPDLFSDVGGRIVRFQRDEAGAVTAFTVVGEDGAFQKR